MTPSQKRARLEPFLDERVVGHHIGLNSPAAHVLLGCMRRGDLATCANCRKLDILQREFDLGMVLYSKQQLHVPAGIKTVSVVFTQWRLKLFSFTGWSDRALSCHHAACCTTRHRRDPLSSDRSQGKASGTIANMSKVHLRPRHVIFCMRSSAAFLSPQATQALQTRVYAASSGVATITARTDC